jgi:hypothetical protein
MGRRAVPVSGSGPTITVRSLRTSYGAVTVADGIDVGVRRGSEDDVYRALKCASTVAALRTVE